jgi:uncharacterized OsmC-like protein
MTQKINGVDVNALKETLAAIDAQPELARFRFEADNEWIGGPVNRTTIDQFFGTCQVHEHSRRFTMTVDEPPVLLGEDNHANPVEYLLAALAGCVTTSMVVHAAARGITINRLSSRLEGDINLLGFLGLDDSVRKGYEAIRMVFEIDADVPREQLEEVVKLGPTFSPVYDVVSRSLPVEVVLADRAAEQAA